MPPALRLKVALMTDDRIVSMLASRALVDEFEVRSFQSAAPNWATVIGEFCPAVIVLRDLLVVGSALDAMIKLLVDSRLSAARFVVLSNAGENGDSYLAAGAAAFVSIPFSPTHLRDTVLRVVRDSVTILYVEDSKVMHRLVVPPLLEDGYSVLEAFDGRQGLALLESGRRIDLILSDVDMPEMDGLGLCKAAKSDPRFRDIPFVLLTARDGEDAVQEGFAAGADDYLMKPVVVPEMLARVQRFLGQKAAQREERVLVVEPDATIAHAIERCLATHGLHCDFAQNADEASALLEEGRYAIAVVECKLPVVDGVTLVRRIRGAPRTRDIPVIMTSGCDSLGEQVRVRSVGPESFVVKPFSQDRLLAEVERTLANARHRRQISAMRGYLSDGAIDAIERRTADGNVEPRAEYTFRTIFFLDIVGFTTLCESLAPLDAVRFLNGFFDGIVPILTKHGASIDKFIGDCVMALFPRELLGPQSAVTAALAIIEHLPELRTRTGIDVHVRVGINAGAVVLGDIGSAHHRRDFTAIGDHVNVAARLQTSAGVDEVFVSEAVAKQLPAGFAVTEVGLLPVKGRRAAVLAYRVRADGPLPPSTPRSNRPQR